MMTTCRLSARHRRCISVARAEATGLRVKSSPWHRPSDSLAYAGPLMKALAEGARCSTIDASRNHHGSEYTHPWGMEKRRTGEEAPRPTRPPLKDHGGGAWYSTAAPRTLMATSVYWSIHGLNT